MPVGLREYFDAFVLKKFTQLDEPREYVAVIRVALEVTLFVVPHVRYNMLQGLLFESDPISLDTELA